MKYITKIIEALWTSYYITKNTTKGWYFVTAELTNDKRVQFELFSLPKNVTNESLKYVKRQFKDDKDLSIKDIINVTPL